MFLYLNLSWKKLQLTLRLVLLFFFSSHCTPENSVLKYTPQILDVWQQHVEKNKGVHKWNSNNGGLRVFQEWTSLLALHKNKSKISRKKMADSLENYVVRQNMQALGKVGTDLPLLGGPRADFDMSLLWCISMIYLFEEERDLLNDASYLHLIKNVTRLWGQEPKYYFEVLMISFQETENHVFMIESTRYLMNQLIMENKRGLPEITQLRDSLTQIGVELDNKKGPVRSLLLKQMYQILTRGFFEFNAKVYQRFTLHALNNLYSFARDEAISTGAQNVMDYAAIKFALQSHKAIRMGPYRRNAEKFRETEFFLDDAICSYYGVLSGIFPYEDADLHSFWLQSYSHASSALFASMLHYRLPQVIQEYFHLDQGHIWSGMKTRHTFNGKLEASPEMYYKTPQFMVTAGGRYKFYRGANFPIKIFSGWKEVPWVYDVTARSSSITISPKDSSIHSPISQVLRFKGNPWQKNNLAMYKNFVYGFHFRDAGDSPSAGESWPQNISPHIWALPKSCFESEYFELCVIDAKQYGMYLNVSKIKPKKTFFKYGYQNYSRGTLEAVDTSRANSFEQFVETEKNLFKQKLGKYEYPLFTGERLFLNPSYQGKRQGIRKIIREGTNGENKKLSVYPGNKSEEEMELLEAYYQPYQGSRSFKVVEAKGDGRLEIRSLKKAKSLIIDSQLWWRPQRIF